MTKKSYIIAGPTASGKSGFALELAKRVGGTIINADSVQLYKGIEVLSSAPSQAEHSRQNARHPGTEFVRGTKNRDPCTKRRDEVATEFVQHSLYSILDLSEQTTVADYLKMAEREFEAATVPIFVGGSGMYIDALVRGISPIPMVSETNRERARRMVLEAPEAARALTDFEFTDKQRMMRALEVFLETGRTIGEWQKSPRIGKLPGRPIKILINPTIDILQDNVKMRLDKMMKNGAMEEARANIDHTNRCIGIEELARVIRGESALEQALESLATRTMQYAKRQKTWFRGKFDADVTIPRSPTEADLEHVLTK